MLGSHKVILRNLIYKQEMKKSKPRFELAEGFLSYILLTLELLCSFCMIELWLDCKYEFNRQRKLAKPADFDRNDSESGLQTTIWISVTQTYNARGTPNTLSTLPRNCSHQWTIWYISNRIPWGNINPLWWIESRGRHLKSTWRWSSLWNRARAYWWWWWCFGKWISFSQSLLRESIQFQLLRIRKV